MRIFLISIFILLVLFFTHTEKALAVLTRPLGGMILVAPVPGVTCPGSTTPGQFTIRPYNLASPGPYLITFQGTKNTPRPGAYFKGKYSVTPLPVCNAGNSPVPTLLIVPLQHQSNL